MKIPDTPEQHVIQSKAMLIDIHTHTYPTSDDSTLTPEELIHRAKLIGLDGVCLTDHDGFWNPADVEKLGKDNDFLVIPGCEVTTEEGHLLDKIKSKTISLKEYVDQQILSFEDRDRVEK